MDTYQKTHVNDVANGEIILNNLNYMEKAHKLHFKSCNGIGILYKIRNIMYQKNIMITVLQKKAFSKNMLLLCDAHKIN